MNPRSRRLVTLAVLVGVVVVIVIFKR